MHTHTSNVPPPPPAAPVISSVAYPGLIPRRSAPSRSSSTARSSLPPIFTDRRTPAAQGVLDTPIEEEDHRLDVDMGGDGYMDNVDTSGSTSLQAPTTDDEPPPPSTPNGEDMELDPGILRERNTSVPVVPIQGPVPVPASVANVSPSTAIVETSDSTFIDCDSASSIILCQSLSSELIFEY